MADDKVEVRDVNFHQVLPWMQLFRGFQVALDPKKMLLAAGGIVTMSFGWFLLSALFAPSDMPPELDRETLDKKVAQIRERHANEAPEQLNQRVADYERRFEAEHQRDVKQWNLLRWTAKAPTAEDPTAGTLRALPWDEARGPNPYLLVAGESRQPWNWRQQAYVVLEPLVKFLRPIKYLLDPNAGFRGHLYFLLCLLWAVATWALFGGAITRMAAVQLTRKEKISMTEALRFAWARYVSFFSAPLFPLLFVFFILLLLVVYGFLHLIPLVGDILVDGVGWPLVLLAGVVMAVILVGLAGWPLMYSTISVEGSDSFDALSRSYSYVYQSPWHYLWNCAVAIAYGVALVFFVCFMGSLMVYLGKWGVAQTPFSGPNYMDREPSYLFIYAPTSFGWRDLLLEGSPYGDPTESKRAIESLNWWNKTGAFMVSVWIHLAFLLVIGFSYSYFWSSSTIIYLLMRRQVDDTDMDEIYLEEDEAEDTYSATVPAPAPGPGPAPMPSAPAPSFQMVEAPTLRSSAPPPPPAPAPTPAQEPAPSAIKTETTTPAPINHDDGPPPAPLP